MTDMNLVERARQGDKVALDELFTRYKCKVLAIARRFFLSGLETEDLVQEGFCGLYSAITGFDKNKHASFSTYAYACIRNRILDVVKLSYTDKRCAANNTVPIVEVGEELFSSEDNPEDTLIKKENKREFLHKISKNLSSFEFKVIVMYMDGLTVTEMSRALEKPPKSIDNALSRSKKKLQKIFTE